MSLLESIFFGIIQGLTEFLPISSTAHLTLFGQLFGKISAEHPEQWTAYIAVIQLGTLLAVLGYFAKDIWQIIRHFLTDNILKPKRFNNQSPESMLGWYILLGTLPIIIVGVLFKELIQSNLTKNLSVIAVSLVDWAILLAIGEKVARHTRGMNQLNWKDALLVGIGQMFALIPGASRSGTTLTFGLFLGLQRETAARFSFLLSIPAVLASGLLELKESFAFITPDLLWSYIMSVVFAFISGYLAIGWLLKFLQTKTTYPFVIYRILLGIGLLVWLWR